MPTTSNKPYELTKQIVRLRNQRDSFRKVIANCRTNLVLDLEITSDFLSRHYMSQFASVCLTQREFVLVNSKSLTGQLYCLGISQCLFVVSVCVRKNRFAETIVKRLKLLLIVVVHWPECFGLGFGQIHI